MLTSIVIVIIVSSRYSIYLYIIFLFSYTTAVNTLESEHGQKLSEWNKKGDRVDLKLSAIELQWKESSYLENATEDELNTQRAQLEVTWLKCVFHRL